MIFLFYFILQTTVLDFIASETAHFLILFFLTFISLWRSAFLACYKRLSAGFSSSYSRI